MNPLAHETLIELHSKLDRSENKSYIEALRWWFDFNGEAVNVSSPQEALVGLYGLFQSFLNSGRYIEAALLIWGRDLFDPRPRSVQRIWSALMSEPKVLIPGGGSQGKSYTPAAWSILNWVRDPAYTSGKIISVTETHAGMNIMATIKMFHENSAIPLPGQRMDKSIVLGNGDRRASISLVALPPGDDGKGRLRGFHPILRPKPHPQFGRKTRLFAIIDEGEDAAGGLWEGLENMLSTQGKRGAEHNLITIASGANPKKRESPYAQRAETPGGWETFDIETSQDWYGPENLGRWRVVRIDPAKSENVMMKDEVYPGMMTYESFLDYQKKGMNHPSYMTFARGAWPEGTTEFNITPQAFFNNSVGVYTFTGSPIAVATFDPAFAEGGDNPIMTTGRYGQVIGFQGIEKPYETFAKPFYGLQYEQQFTIKKDNTLIMAQEVINYLKVLNVRPEWFACDKTGAGWGIYDAINAQYAGALGLIWSEKATDRKILEEDSATAEERFSGIATEMMFTFATWLQYGYIKFAPLMNINKLISQATGRKYFYDGRGLIRSQSKADYKSDTGGQSPDEYDSAIQMPHLIRVRKSQNAAMLPDAAKVKPPQHNLWGKIQGGATDKMEFVDIN